MTDPRSKSAKSDARPRVRGVQDEIYRKMSPAKKFHLVFDIYDMVQHLTRASLKMQHPEATDEEIWHLWARQHLGDELYEEVYGSRNDFGPSKGGG